jgi:hypothetical protein
VHCNINMMFMKSSEEHRREAESCVADSMYRSSELIQESCDSDSWCSYILYVCMLNVMLMVVLLFLLYICFYAMYE